MTHYRTTVNCPIGTLFLFGEADVLTGLFMEESRHGFPKNSDYRLDNNHFPDVRDQLRAYFAGERREFNVRVSPQGTHFQRQVWKALLDIPFGTTESYGSVARRLGKPTASRAIGAANGRNPISIIIPCHRVIGKSGALTGYGGGMPRKRWLLAHEASTDGRRLFQPISIPSDATH